MNAYRRCIEDEKRERLKRLWADYQERLENGDVQERDEADEAAHRADHDCKCQREYDSDELSTD